jgi:hypothetical protein
MEVLSLDQNIPRNPNYLNVMTRDQIEQVLEEYYEALDLMCYADYEWNLNFPRWVEALDYLWWEVCNETTEEVLSALSQKATETCSVIKIFYYSWLFTWRDALVVLDRLSLWLTPDEYDWLRDRVDKNISEEIESKYS